MDLTPLQRIDEFHLVHRLGAGGFSEVWLARDEQERHWALKFPRVADFLEHLRREATLTGAFPSLPERVVAVEQARLDHSPPYLVLQYVDGNPLPLPQAVPPPEGIVEGLRVIDQIAWLLGELHALGIVHGDIKPQNVLLSPDRQQCWLLDLGLAVHQVQTRQRRSLAQSLVSVDGEAIGGTLEYMAPELLEGRAPSVASDLYSLGMLLHELLVGRPPSFGVAPSALNPYLTADVETLLARVLSRDPAERPGSAVELRYELKRLIKDEERCLARKAGHERRRIFHERMDVLFRGLGALSWIGVSLAGIAGSIQLSMWFIFRLNAGEIAGTWSLLLLPTVGLLFLGMLLAMTTINAWIRGVAERDYKTRKGHPLWTFMMQ